MGFPIQIQQGEIRCFLTDLQKCLIIHAAIITEGMDPQNLRIDVELDLVKESTLDIWLVLLSHHVEAVLLEIQDGYRNHMSMGLHRGRGMVEFAP